MTQKKNLYSTQCFVITNDVPTTKTTVLLDGNTAKRMRWMPAQLSIVTQFICKAVVEGRKIVDGDYAALQQKIGPSPQLKPKVKKILASYIHPPIIVQVQANKKVLFLLLLFLNFNCYFLFASFRTKYMMPQMNNSLKHIFLLLTIINMNVI